MDRDRHELIRILQGAYSGELAAGLAYRGHWKSVSRADERTAIQKIEREEAVHRQRVGEMLTGLGSAPGKLREARMWLIGRTIGLSCHALGRFLPMYFAGRLESGNVVEYKDAADRASALGLSEFEADLLVMARVEKEHELFFLSMVAGHRLLTLMQGIFGWGGCDTETPRAPENIGGEPEPASQTSSEETALNRVFVVRPSGGSS